MQRRGQAERKRMVVEVMMMAVEVMMENPVIYFLG